ncbi:MAG: CinA family nicotinamide mononucleotide deamidase-related protein [Anaerolineales bacterium]
MTIAEIITIGTELLLGETTDTNTRFIARALRGLGVDLFRTTTIGDNPGRIAAAIREAMGRAEIIITTGGLGPTVDDPTRRAVAEAVGVPLEYRPDLWEQIERTVRRYGRVPTPNQKRQAYVPQGARAIANPVGTAPAFIVETERNAVIALPGVPREMETLLTEAVIPYLQQRFGLHEILKIRTLHCSGVGESAVDEQIGDLETLANPTVGLAAHAGIIDIRIAAKADSEAEADRQIAALETEIRARLGADIFGADDQSLEAVTLEAAGRRGWSLACFEAGTGGLLAERLSRLASPVYRGGERSDEPPPDLSAAAEAARLRYGASASLALSLSIRPEAIQVDFHLHTPAATRQQHLTYGGHPRNAARWAVNMAIDSLRRAALETA